MSVASIAERQQNLIRKAQDAVVFVADESAQAIEAITVDDPGNPGTPILITLPSGWTSLGHHTEDDGINWTRDVSSEDVRSHGSSEPTRRDIVSDVSGLTVLAQESKEKTMELFHNMDLSGVVADATTSEVGFNRPTVPATRYYQLLALASDGAGADIIYFARFCPRVAVTDFAEQPWTKADAVRWPLTFTAFVDSTLGYSMREMWGGQGMQTLATDMGFV